MKLQELTNLAVEIDTADVRRRFYEILPGALSWSTLIGLTVLSFFIPFWIAIFVILYDLYALIRGVYMSIHLVYAYRRLGQEKQANWIVRCQGVSRDITHYLESLKAKAGLVDTDRELTRHIHDVENIITSGRDIVPWGNVHQVVIYPTYDESLAVLRTSLRSLAATDFPKERIHVVVGFEERNGEVAREKPATMTQEFCRMFK
ncbi:MAG: hypothetical protein WD972_02245, partial [Candidatus Andersenbacteria bacterium]